MATGPPTGSDPLNALAEEFVGRYRRGERPALSEYTARHPELAEEIRELFPALVMMEDLGSVGGQPAPPGPAAVPEQLGDFRILREIGRGGMGVVYEAVQESLGRPVALKILPFHHLMEASHLERFRREARAAAQLHHTNIVPVFGVGEHEGIHFYAMQYIQGQSLDEVVEEVKKLREGKPGAEDASPRPGSASVAGALLTGEFEAQGLQPLGLESASQAAPTFSGSSSQLTRQPEVQYFRSVARLGVQIADALHYAHRQGILHRDIKPSNLLLDLRGTVWITDFGLAKTEDSGGLTKTGDIVGTVRFMPPERLDGTSEPCGDLYSLGVTLYEMLTLRPAFADTQRSRLIEHILHDDPPRPRKLDPAIPSDLETIVLKAMAKRPADRYATAADMAEDLRRFLADRPIRARRTSWREQAWRWCRRNPAIAGLTAALFLALAAGLMGTTFLWLRADRKEAEATANYRLAEQERVAAQQARDRAAQGFQQAKQAVDDCFNLVSKHPLLKQPEMKPVRKLLVDETLKYYREFLAQHGDDPAVQKELADIFNRAGVIQQAIGQTPDALAAYAQSRDLWSRLVAANPADTDCWQGLAKALNNFGQLQAEQNNYTEAIRAVEEAVRIRRRLAAADPKFQANLARTLTGLAQRYDETERRAEALHCFQEAEHILRSLTAAKPADIWVQVELARCCDNAGNCLQAAGQLEEALRSFEEARRLHRQLAAKNPKEPLFARNVAIGAVNLGSLHLQAGRPAAALRALEEARQIAERLTTAHAQDHDYQFLLAYCLYGLGEAHQKTGRTDLAVRILEQARTVQERLLAKDPKALKYQEALARIHYDLGSLRRDLGQTSASLQSLERARQLRQQLLKERPGNRDYQRGLANALDLIGRQQLDHHPAVAHTVFEEALHLRRELAERDPADPTKQRELAQGYGQLGLAKAHLGRPTEALTYLDQARRINEALLAARSNSPDDCANLGEVLGQRMVLLEKLGRGPEAHEVGRQAIDCQLRALRLGYDLGALRVDLSSYLVTLARWRGDSGQAAAAAAKVLGGARPWGRDPFQYVRAGWGLVRCILLVGQGRTIFTAEEEAERRLYTELAWSAFRQAVLRGI